MLKKSICLFLPWLLGACAFSQPLQGDSCPWVSIVNDKSYLTQKMNYHDEFRIELIGYEGYCWLNLQGTRRYAVITPLFKIIRLNPSDDSRIDFDFYAQTVQGPPQFLGKKSYGAQVDIAPHQTEKKFKGPEIQVLIPREEPIEILLALDISAAEYDYNRRTFDVPARPYGSKAVPAVYTPVSSAPVAEPQMRAAAMTDATPADTSSCGCGK